MSSSRAALILIALVACKRQPPPAPAPAPAPPAPPAAAPIEEAQVKALLDQWLSAQNSGAFDRYQKLYAAKFQGVRRSGPRTVRLDRAGWVKDRQRMFAKPMTVEIAEPDVARSANTARVQFQQTFASGNYKDVGRKELVIVREGDGLRIAREEMLASRIVGADHRDLANALMLVDDAGVVLRTNPDEAWATGSIRPGKGQFTSLRSVDLAKLPADLADWRTRKLRLMGAAGPVCETKVAGFSLVARVTPHFGATQEWEGREGSETPGKPWSPARIAAELWAEAGGEGRVLAGELADKCAGALWAFDADKTAPAVAAAVPIKEAPLREAALRALRRLPLHAQIQKDWPRKGLWSESEEMAIFAWRFDHPRGALLMMSMEWNGGCAEFGGDLTGLFRVGGTEAAPKLDLLSAMSYGQLAAPLSAFDLDGDGNLEILFGPEGLRQERGLYELAGDAYDRFILVQTPYHDCPC